MRTVHPGYAAGVLVGMALHLILIFSVSGELTGYAGGTRDSRSSRQQSFLLGIRRPHELPGMRSHSAVLQDRPGKLAPAHSTTGIRAERHPGRNDGPELVEDGYCKGKRLLQKGYCTVRVRLVLLLMLEFTESVPVRVNVNVFGCAMTVVG